MTSQTQKFIESSDILTLKLECAGCGSTLAIPSSKDIKNDVGKLGSCPICRRTWADSRGYSYEPLIAHFMSVLNNLRDALAKSETGFNLTIEIADDTGSNYGEKESDNANTCGKSGRKTRA